MDLARPGLTGRPGLVDRVADEVADGVVEEPEEDTVGEEEGMEEEVSSVIEAVSFGETEAVVDMLLAFAVAEPDLGRRELCPIRGASASWFLVVQV